MIWFQTDPHLFHTNILKFTGKDGKLIRPGFENIDQMNDCILTHHNERVTAQDKVYWLGDITMKVDDTFVEYFKKFTGKHRIIPGNHDDVKKLIPLFQKVYGVWRVFNEPDAIVFSCTHIPIDVLSIRGHFNVHGHIHQNPSPTRHHINICPEVRDYKPTSFDELQVIMRARLMEEELATEWGVN
jgi:calcineurin-like phosphoesterase family protein